MGFTGTNRTFCNLVDPEALEIDPCYGRWNSRWMAWSNLVKSSHGGEKQIDNLVDVLRVVKRFCSLVQE